MYKNCEEKYKLDLTNQAHAWLRLKGVL